MEIAIGTFIVALCAALFATLAPRSEMTVVVSGPSPERDKRRIEKGECPDCGSKELLGGPSGGMSQNVGCNHCLMEFNVHHHFGGILGVDRTGKMNKYRAAVFGIASDEYDEITKDNPRDKFEPYFNDDGN